MKAEDIIFPVFFVLLVVAFVWQDYHEYKRTGTSTMYKIWCRHRKLKTLWLEEGYIRYCVKCKEIQDYEFSMTLKETNEEPTDSSASLG